jgi:glycogen debranching enzyme
VGAVLRAAGRDPGRVDALRRQAADSFCTRFVRPDGAGLFDVVDGQAGADASLRPNQLLAVSLGSGPLAAGSGATADVAARSALEACRPLLTPLGLRSLDIGDPRYRALHRGGPAERDAAYHQGTVWPWLAGPWVDASRRVGRDDPALLDGLRAHLSEWGLGSVSETADGQAPHDATGCPFQAWSVAEFLRVLRRG